MLSIKIMLRARNIDYNFLLAAINPEEKDLSRMFKKYRDALDWDWLLAFSQEKKISGIFRDSLNNVGITQQLSRKTQNRLTLIQNKANQQLKRAYNTLKQLSKGFIQEQIPFIVLKGSVFAEEIYRNPGIRLFHDIDLLVPQHLLRKAEDILISLGYKFYCPPLGTFSFVPLRHKPKKGLELSASEDVARRFFTRYHIHFPFVLPREDKRLPIDLHWHLFFPGSCKIGSDSIWEFTREVSSNDLRFRTLTVEMTLVYLAYNIAIRGPMSFRFLTLCDFVRYLNSFKNRYNVQLLWQIADKWAARKYVKFSLALANRLFNCDTSPILVHACKNNFVSDCFLHLATNKSVLIEPFSRRMLFQKFAASFLWELSLVRLPRTSARKLVMWLIEFFHKRILAKKWF